MSGAVFIFNDINLRRYRDLADEMKEFARQWNPRTAQSVTLLWHHDDHDGVSNHQPHGCLLNRLFRRRSKKTSKLRVTGLCVGNSPGPVNSPHKGPVTWKMFPFDDVIMISPKTSWGWCAIGTLSVSLSLSEGNPRDILAHGDTSCWRHIWSTNIGKLVMLTTCICTSPGTKEFWW